MKKRKIAMLVMTGVLLTGCMGTNYLEEGKRVLARSKRK